MILPSPLLNEVKDPPPKCESTDKMTRLRHKLFHIWSLWSDLRENEEICQLLLKGEDDDVLRNVMISLMDRLGRILSNTNIIEELYEDVESMESILAKD